MTIAPNTATKRKPGRPRKASLESNPFEAALKASREAYDSTKGSTRNPTPPQLTVLQGGKAKGSTATNGSVLASSDTKVASMGHDTQQGPQILPPLPSPRAQGYLTSPVEYVKGMSDGQIAQWAASYIATGNRRRWLTDSCPGIGRENDRWKADLIGQLERHPVAIETLAQLKAEQVMSDLERRKLLKSIAHCPEHPMKGYADNIKAIELDARHDPESCMSKANREQGTAQLPPINLFFLPQGAARPMQVATATPVTLDIAGPASPPPGGG